MNLCTIGYGCSVGWMASAFLILTSDNCPLPTGPISMPEIGWIGAILGIGGLIGTVVVGWLANVAGRKNSMIFMAVPQIVCFFFFFILYHHFVTPELFPMELQSILTHWSIHCYFFFRASIVVAFLQISLMLIIYAQNVYYLYASRFLLGFVGGALSVIVPLMVAEIAEDR